MRASNWNSGVGRGREGLAVKVNGGTHAAPHRPAAPETRAAPFPAVSDAANFLLDPPHRSRGALRNDPRARPREREPMAEGERREGRCGGSACFRAAPRRPVRPRPRAPPGAAGGGRARDTRRSRAAPPVGGGGGGGGSGACGGGGACSGGGSGRGGVHRAAARRTAAGPRAGLGMPAAPPRRPPATCTAPPSPPRAARPHAPTPTSSPNPPSLAAAPAPARAPPPAPPPAAKRLKTLGAPLAPGAIRPSLLEPASAAALRAAHDSSGPYTHVVLRGLAEPALLRAVRDEVINNVQATYKETDLFKVFQTGEAAVGSRRARAGAGAPRAAAAGAPAAAPRRRAERDRRAQPRAVGVGGASPPTRRPTLARLRPPPPRPPRRPGQPGRARPRKRRQAAVADAAARRALLPGVQGVSSYGGAGGGRGLGRELGCEFGV
jgi:hypothetical protein